MSQLNESTMVKLINGARQQAGLQPLFPNMKLQSAAGKQSTFMNMQGVLTHRGFWGSSLEDRAIAAKYHWSALGECIGETSEGPISMFNIWMNSPPHKQIILNPIFLDFAVAQVGHYWTANFGAPVHATAISVSNPEKE